MKDLSTNQRNIENSCHIPDLVLTMSEETVGKNLVLQLGKISTFFTFVYSFVMLTKLSEQPKTITTKDKQKKKILENTISHPNSCFLSQRFNPYPLFLLYIIRVTLRYFSSHLEKQLSNYYLVDSSFTNIILSRHTVSKIVFKGKVFKHCLVILKLKHK